MRFRAETKGGNDRSQRGQGEDAEMGRETRALGKRGLLFGKREVSSSGISAWEILEPWDIRDVMHKDNAQLVQLPRLHCPVTPVHLRECRGPGRALGQLQDLPRGLSVDAARSRG